MRQKERACAKNAAPKGGPRGGSKKKWRAFTRLAARARGSRPPRPAALASTDTEPLRRQAGSIRGTRAAGARAARSFLTAPPRLSLTLFSGLHRILRNRASLSGWAMVDGNSVFINGERERKIHLFFVCGGIDKQEMKDGMSQPRPGPLSRCEAARPNLAPAPFLSLSPSLYLS